MVNSPPAARPRSVYFFGTCLIDLFYPGAGLAGIKLLQSQGIEVIFPPDQSCCGQPAYSAGHFEEARAVAKAQIALFSKDIPIVVPSGSCGGMMKKHYPELFHGTPLQAEAEDFCGRVYELTQFLVDVLDLKLADLGKPTRVAYHPSCHAMREMGVGDQPKSLIRQLANVELVDIPRERECCGFGGTFAVRHAEVSAVMVGEKLDAIETTGADVVISSDCGCLMNIGGALEAQAKPTRPLHIAEFLWERTHGR